MKIYANNDKKCEKNELVNINQKKEKRYAFPSFLCYYSFQTTFQLELSMPYTVH